MLGHKEPLSVGRGSMDTLWCLLLAHLLHQATRVSGEEEVTRATGKSVTFRLQGLDEKAIAWSFHNDIIVTVKFGNPPETTFFDNSYKPRLAFPENGSALTISELRVEDAGTYTAKTATGKNIFTLHVYRELEVPTVTCSGLNCSAGICSYILHCTAAGPGSGNISYAWSMGRWLWTEGPTVLVEKLPSDESPLTCTAQNPVSSRNTTVTALSAFCAENTTQPPTAGSYSSRQAGVVAAVVTGAGVLLAVVFVVICCRSKGWKSFSLPAPKATNTEAGADYTTVYAEVGPSQQVHLQTLTDAQRDDPKKAPNPDVETSKTIYFTVQALGQTDDEKMGNSLLGRGEQDEKTIYSSVS